MLLSAYLSTFALQAVAAQHHEAFVQLVRKQKLLDEQHDIMSAKVRSFDEWNGKASAEIRTHVNAFLSELISVMGRQFEKLQAYLMNSHAETIRVCAAALLRHISFVQPWPYLYTVHQLCSTHTFFSTQ